MKYHYDLAKLSAICYSLTAENGTIFATYRLPHIDTDFTTLDEIISNIASKENIRIPLKKEEKKSVDWTNSEQKNSFLISKEIGKSKHFNCQHISFYNELKKPETSKSLQSKDRKFYPCFVTILYN